MALEDSIDRQKIREAMVRRIGNLLTAKKRGKWKSSGTKTNTSTFNDNATTFSVDGEKSVALTVDSQLTVKVSNRKPAKNIPKKSPPSNQAKAGWKTLKRFVGSVSNQKGDSKSAEFKSDRSIKSTGSITSNLASRKRIFSEDRARSKASFREQTEISTRIRSQLDLAIRGRHDGVDILSLGDVRGSGDLPGKGLTKGVLENHDRERDNSEAGLSDTVNFSFDPFEVSFTAMSNGQKPRDIIETMIRSSSGKEQSELMLEGYIPGGGDRWSVVLANTLPESEAVEASLYRSERVSPEYEAGNQQNTFLDTDDDTADLSDDGSTNMPTHKLWDQMWGQTSPPPTPSHMQCDPKSGEGGKEDVMQLAASCSVPVDLDEDTFIIEGPEHYNSIRDLAMVSLQGRKFDTALSIFEKMLHGLKETNDPKLEHIQASTLHNMGIIYLCQAKFEEAERSFEEAVYIRTQCLSQNHPDVAVSLMRQGEAALAMENYEDALKNMKLAIEMSPAEDATRAKMLNNIGIVHFHQGNFPESLRVFTAGLEIQRQWLDGPVRRESIVYDASITLGNMGRVFLRMEQLEVAYSIFEEACLVSDRHSGFVQLCE